MHRLPLPIITLLLVLAFGCAREPAEEPGPDTTAMDAQEAPPPQDMVSEWVRQGETKAIRTPNGKACVFVRPPAIVGLGDSVRFSISLSSPTDSTLQAEADLSPGFRAARQSGREVFAPVYDFRAHDVANKEITQFPDTLIFAICSVAYKSQGEAFERAVLARDPEGAEGSLQLMPPLEPPAECQLSPSCWKNPAGKADAATSARWLQGTPVTPSPAYAAETEFKKGIGGGGTSNSPFAAVDSVAGAEATQAP